MKVLIVEDERKTAEYLRKGLTESGFVATVTDNGFDGRHLALTRDYDLVIVDVMLPGIDGWTVVRDLRLSKQTPTIFLTARDAVEDRVKGLDLGADDYLVKPFAFSELLARARSIMRRGVQQPSDVLQAGGLTVDLVRRLVWRTDGEPVHLTPKEFSLLALLMRRRGEVLSRTLIAEQVWDMHFDSGTNVVDVAVKRLRAKLGDNSDNKLIRTIRGVGYVLEQSG